MRMKKLVPILALTLGLTAFSGCTDTNQKIAFGEYWQLDALAPVAINETLTYEVKFEANAQNATDYTLDYTNGSYVTNLSSVMEDGKTIYVYQSVLTITAAYTFKGVTKTSEDVVTSEVRFQSAKGALAPISSKKAFKSASPTTGTHVSVDECFQSFIYSVDNDYTTKTSIVKEYDKDGKELSSETKNFDFEDSDKYSVIDNEQLFVALRAVPDTVTSGTLLAYSPFTNLEQKINFSFASAEGAKFKYFDSEAEKEVEKQINYRPVSITLDQNNPGATQTAWIASKLSNSMNSTRNLLLRLETPLAYDLGTMVYTLKSVSHQQ